MDGDRVDIIGLGWALRCDDLNATKRIPRDGDASTAGNDNSGSFQRTPGGSDPRFIAPESLYYLSSSKESSTTTSSTRDDDEAYRVWNGFRDDLWATGLILYSMVVGTDALFSAPIAEDKRFTRLCIRGDVRGEAQRFGKQSGKDYSSLSDDLVSLLQSMLSVDPRKRPTLEQVMEDTWVTKDDASVTPTNCTTGLQHPFAL